MTSCKNPTKRLVVPRLDNSERLDSGERWAATWVRNIRQSCERYFAQAIGNPVAHVLASLARNAEQLREIATGGRGVQRDDSIRLGVNFGDLSRNTLESRTLRLRD